VAPDWADVCSLAGALPASVQSTGERLGLGVLALLEADPRQIEQAIGRVAIRGPEHLLADRQSTLKEGLGVRALAQLHGSP